MSKKEKENKVKDSQIRPVHEMSDQERKELEEMEKEASAMEEADAKAVAVARERKAAKKRKARKRKIIIAGIILAVIAAAVATYVIHKKQVEASKDTTVSIEADSGQDVVYAQITSMKGNEMTYTVLEESEEETETETETVLVPVGTDVTTALGAVTTFSRLGSGDNIALVMDGDEIVRIYIVG